MSEADRTERIGWLVVWALMATAALLKVTAYALEMAGL